MFQHIFGKKINKTRITPLTTKIIIIFTLFILVSNLASNYINLTYNRSGLVKFIRESLIRDLKEMYTICNTQYEIYEYGNDYRESVKNIERNALEQFKNKKSIFLGVKENGTIVFQASRLKKYHRFLDPKTLTLMRQNYRKGILEGALPFRFNGDNYFGLYKYNLKWDAYIIRGEEYNEFYAESTRIFRTISLIIIFITLFTAILGGILLNYITRFISVITDRIMTMTDSQQLDIIDLKGATNDDITFLGMAFNSLAGTINNLLLIFRKFVNRDIAQQAYQEREVRLEGKQMELSILFSDIKRFTFITETLGTDIIKLLNVHYDNTIKEIIKNNGIIGSIIGDALLAVYGVLNESTANKSYQAVVTAYKIQAIASSLRETMRQKREQIVSERGVLSEMEEKVYQAVLIEVGVGIDGGVVFYGNIGSYERMTNTVIGDNVNAASRLEGLTRIYNVPIIVSGYVKDDIEKNVSEHGLIFMEIDRVLVKGKTIGAKIYWPILKKNYDEKVELRAALNNFSQGLQFYYEGDWKNAHRLFAETPLAVAEVFKERTEAACPEKWDGIWKMTSK
ncbi:MAG TPA: adenylate/guanylate cyclase domain-containing protein [Firmicutes bacterium]|jgi:adenylate cyclase|nr:adenylate/guanylate cyclase domain-containing protein [Bacillota bacterium]